MKACLMTSAIDLGSETPISNRLIPMHFLNRLEWPSRVVYLRQTTLISLLPGRQGSRRYHHRASLPRPSLKHRQVPLPLPRSIYREDVFPRTTLLCQSSSRPGRLVGKSRPSPGGMTPGPPMRGALVATVLSDQESCSRATACGRQSESRTRASEGSSSFPSEGHDLPGHVRGSLSRRW